MECDKCKSTRVAQIGGKCSDCCEVYLKDVSYVSYDGYVPTDLGVGGRDYIDFCLCLDCGKVQGKFPVSPTSLDELSGD